MKMKKTFEKPELFIIIFGEEDIITGSNPDSYNPEGGDESQTIFPQP